MKRNVKYITLMVILLTMALLSRPILKRIRIQNAINNQLEKKAEENIKAENDTTPPEILCTTNVMEYEVPDKIDYERIKMSLTAYDNIDGNITNKIEQISSTVIEHEEGLYEITYRVEDCKGNAIEYKLPVLITSKYDKLEKGRLNNCIKAYNKLSTVLKAPNTLRLSNINTNEEGSIIVVNYSAQNSFGAYLKGRVAYFSDLNYIYELEDEELPNDFIIGEYTYEYEDIKEFNDYYHPEEKQ